MSDGIYSLISHPSRSRGGWCVRARGEEQKCSRLQLEGRGSHFGELNITSVQSQYLDFLSSREQKMKLWEEILVLSILQIFLIVFIHSFTSASHLLFPPAALLGLRMEEEYFRPSIYEEVNWFIIHFSWAPEVFWTEVGVFKLLLSLVYYDTRICYFPLSHTKRMKY